jgi:hypothetical protein
MKHLSLKQEKTIKRLSDLKISISKFAHGFNHLNALWSDLDDPIIQDLLNEGYPLSQCHNELTAEVNSWTTDLLNKIEQLAYDVQEQAIFEHFRKTKEIEPLYESDGNIIYDGLYGQNDLDIRYCWSYADGSGFIGIQNNGLYCLILGQEETNGNDLVALEKRLFDFLIDENVFPELNKETK